ncbi:MAG: DUF190 domain-containing protein [Acidothermaceae bacterium]
MSVGAHLELSVVVSEHAHFHHVPVYVELVRRAHKQGVAGASVFRGIEGFGHSHRVHEAHAFELKAHTPVMVVIVDTETRIREFLPYVQEVSGGDTIITLRPVEVLSAAVGRR